MSDSNKLICLYIPREERDIRVRCGKITKLEILIKGDSIQRLVFSSQIDELFDEL